MRKTENVLTIYRRHAHGCKGNDLGCSCPLWCYGYLQRKMIRRSLNTCDLVLAKQYRDALVDETKPAADGIVHKLLADAVEEFLKDKAARDRSGFTLKNYRAALERFTEFAKGRGITFLAQVKPDPIRAFVQAGDLMPRTRNNNLTYLRVFFSWCEKAELILRNPAKKVDPAEVSGYARTALSVEEVEAVQAAIETMPIEDKLQFRALVQVLLFTGLRIRDAVMLRRIDVNLETRSLAIIPHKTRRIRKVLRLSLHPVAVAALESLPAASEAFFWPERTVSGRINLVGRRFTQLNKVLGWSQPVVPHLMRHTIATRLLDNGEDIHTVSKILGHSSVQITEKYLSRHPTERIAAAIGNLNYQSATTIAKAS